jgi:transposase-like protein
MAVNLQCNTPQKHGVDHQHIPAPRLDPEAKKAIVLDALSGVGITQAARKHDVCRNSVYAQKNEAEAAMDQVFVEKTETKVLFYVPIST